MASIFNALHIGYSGLSAAQAGVAVTGHNIANAETAGYTRQRVVTAASMPLDTSPGSYGSGVSITEVARIFDAFTYERYVDATGNKEYSDYMRRTMEELSTYFPDIDGVGIKNDLHNYLNMWQTFADNPGSSAIKVALAEETKALSQNINYTREQISDLQTSINEQLKTNIDEINKIAEDITQLNHSIALAESDGIVNANDLRDQRNTLEMSLARLIGAEVFEGGVESNITTDSMIAEKNGSYTIQVGGFNIVDGSTFHPIGISKEDNALGFYELFYKRQDGVKLPFTTGINEGKVGALMDLRGSVIDEETGSPQNGVLQETLSNLDEFARALIENTNNVYAKASTTRMHSNQLNVDGANSLMNYPELGMNTGSFDLVVYDIEGNEVSRKSINIDTTTSMNNIASQVAQNSDDNADNNATNDVDDFLIFVYDNVNTTASIVFKDAQLEKDGYRFSLQDNTPSGASSGTNFAGATGLSRFFDGNDAKTITLHSALKADPSQIAPYQENIAGNNTVALNIVQLQFENFTFKSNGENFTDTLYGYYDSLVTEVGSYTNSIIHLNDTHTAQFNAIELEYQSISKVSIDEELTNLIKYQTAYGAASKVITTIDQMLTTLLGIKQ